MIHDTRKTIQSIQVVIPSEARADEGSLSGSTIVRLRQRFLTPCDGGFEMTKTA